MQRQARVPAIHTDWRDYGNVNLWAAAELHAAVMDEDECIVEVRDADRPQQVWSLKVRREECFKVVPEKVDSEAKS